MIDLIGKNILFEAIKILLETINKNNVIKLRERKSLIIAITSLNKAILETKNFIQTSGYQPNVELADLWNRALRDCVVANLKDEVPQYLYSKSRFWGSPQDWLNTKASLEIVPRLEYLQNLCDELMNKFEN